MKKQTDPAINHTLLSNGLDFVESSVSSITKNKPDEIKYSVLHLFAGTLLILKERIHREHWSLLFQKVEQANIAKFNSGDFEGITYERIIHVLKEVCSIDLDKSGLKALDDLRKIRNKVEHFQFNISISTIKPITANVLNFLISFIEKELTTDELDDDQQSQFSDIKEISRSFDEYVKVRVSSVIEFSKKNKKDVFHCPDCFEKALVRDDTDFKCYVCDLEGASIDDVANAHLDHELDICTYSYAKDGAEVPLHDCPECTELAFVPENQKYASFICVSCGYSEQTDNVQTCTGCQSIYVSEEDLTYCKNCWDYKTAD